MNNWDDYRFLITTVSEGNITRAARRLGVNHSTVSRRLSSLETKLGASLLENSQDGLVLTPAGVIVHNAALKAELEITGANHRVAAKDASCTGNLIVSAPDNLVHSVLLPKIGEFFQKHPKITIQFHISNEIVSIHNHDADVALRLTNSPPEGLIGRKLTKTATALYAAKSYFENRKNRGSQEPHWYVTQIDAKKKPDWVLAHYPEAISVCSTSTTVSKVAAVQAGLGIALLPCRIGDDNDKLTRCAPFNTSPGPDLWILYHNNLRNAGRLRAFSKFISETIRAEHGMFAGQK